MLRRSTCNTSRDWPLATLTRIGSFKGRFLRSVCFPTFALINESDAKCVVTFRTNGRISNGIGEWLPGTFYFTNEAVFQDSAEIWITAVIENAVWLSAGTAIESKGTSTSSRATAPVDFTGVLLDISTAWTGKAGSVKTMHLSFLIVF